MDFKSKFSFFSPEFVEHDVQGQTLKFYPITPRAAFKMRSMAMPLVQSLTILFTRHDNDVAQESKVGKDGIAENVKIAAISAELAKERTKEREAAVGKAINTLLNPDNAAVVGMLLADSLRDDMPRDISVADAKRFVDEMPLPALKDMLIGLGKANKKIFGPLVDKAGDLVKKGLAAANLSDPIGGETSKTE